MAVRGTDPPGNCIAEGVRKGLPRGDLREGLGKQGSAPCWRVSGSRANSAISQCDLEGGKARPKLKLSLAKGQQAQPSQEKAVWALRWLGRCSCLPALNRGS